MKRDRQSFPPRLIEGENATAELLRKFERQPPHAPTETAAWEATLTRLGRDSGHLRSRLVLAAVTGAVAGAVALYVALAPMANPNDQAANSTASTSARQEPTRQEPTRQEPTRQGPTDIVSPLPLPVTSNASTGSPSRATRPAPADIAVEIPRIQLGQAAVGLPAGQAQLMGEAKVTLSRGGSARAFNTATAATIELRVGEVELHVEKRRADADHAFQVAAGPYRFTVLGTIFRVSKAKDDITLSVSEGRVAVSRGGKTLTIVTGGGFWSGRDEAPRAPSSAAAVRPSTSATVAAPSNRLAWAGAAAPVVPDGTKMPSVPAVEPAPLTSPTPVQAIPTAKTAPKIPTLVAASPPAPSPQVSGGGVALLAGAHAAPGGACASLTASAPRAALDCFLNQARGSNLGAQVALYEAARLYRDALGDNGRAVGTFRELRRRFPGGALATEATLSMAELLPKLGNYREALDATSAVLATHPARERADELHLLRGELLRAGLDDCAAATVEYAAAREAASDSVSDPASFGRALCLEKLGRSGDAREAYERYLARPNARRASEAMRHLAALRGASP